MTLYHSDVKRSQNPEAEDEAKDEVKSIEL